MVFEMILFGEGMTENEFTGYDDIEILPTGAIVYFKDRRRQDRFHKKILKEGKYDVLTYHEFEAMIKEKFPWME
jgi:hypothetical protein